MVVFSKIILVTILVASLGLHWILLQSVAWACMLIRYSASAPFTQALVMTFDGRHPCGLCKLVKDGKKAEQQPINQTSKGFPKLDLFLESGSLAFDFVAVTDLHFPPIKLGVSRSESPPTPPPRSV